MQTLLFNIRTLISFLTGEACSRNNVVCEVPFYINQSTYADTLRPRASKRQIMSGIQIGDKNVQKLNSLYNPCFYSNLCIKSEYYALISLLAVHLNRKINEFVENSLELYLIIGLNQKCPEISKNMSGILDPRILPFRSSALCGIVK